MVASEFDSATGGVNPATQTFATIKVLRSTADRQCEHASDAIERADEIA